MRGYDWVKTEVSGLPALKVDGSPVDCVELAKSYFKKPFDLVISGINWGPNMSSAVYSSGTFNAAMRAAALGVGTHVLAMSWDLPSSFYLHHHQETSIAEYLEYPGKTAAQLIEKIVANNYWGYTMLNVNFPKEPSTTIRLTKIIADVTQCWGYSHETLPENGGRHGYGADRVFNPDLSAHYDVKALTDGVIAISPCTVEITPADAEPLLGTELQVV
jgi:5'-nucleotidase